jgi:glycosyltransferase involved in cell wall biosynthesis
MTVLSVVIPAYNEEHGIADIARRVLEIQRPLSEVGVGELEVLVVDDGSRDDTAHRAEAVPGVRLIRHPRNVGYGAALKTGFFEAKGDLIGFLDADGTYPPEAFPQLCRLAMNGADLVIGSRMSGAESRMPLTRRVGNMFFAALLTVLGHQRVTDSASGMRVFRKAILERLYPLPDGLNLTPVMSVRAIHEGLRTAEVPIAYHERVGRSKLSVVRDGSLFLRSILWTVLSYNPVRILGALGLMGIAFAVAVALGLVAARLTGGPQLAGWGVAALYGGLVAGFSGASLFILGATFNYLVALLHVRPVRQGLFGRPLFNPPLENHFGWLGLCGLAAGALVGAASLVFGVGGWTIERLWLYLTGSAGLILLGVQLVTSWIVLRVLDELRQRASGPSATAGTPREGNNGRSN